MDETNGYGHQTSFSLNTPSVMGFLGGGKKPNPLLPDEVKRIVGRITKDEGTERTDTIFRSGDK